MKNLQLRTISLLLLFSLMASSSFSRELHKETKTIKKEYKVGANATVSVYNKFGSIEVIPWDQNVVSIEAEIIVNNKSENRAKKILDGINIDFSGDQTSVKAITNYGNSDKKICIKINQNNTAHVHYKVKVPNTNNLKLRNIFGDIYVGDMLGSVDVRVEYGSLRGGKFNNKKNKLHLLFSKTSTIDFIHTTDLTMEYSDLEINDVNSVTNKSNFSRLTLGSVIGFSGTSEYDKIKIGSCVMVTLNSKFSKIYMDKLVSNFVLDNEFGSIFIKEIDQSFSKIKITNQFGAIKINTKEELMFTLESTMNMCSMKYPPSWKLSRKKSHSFSSYKGDINGKGSLISIDSEHGNVAFYKK